MTYGQLIVAAAILVPLTVYRLTRIMVEDSWPPTEALRNWLERRTGRDSGWTTLATCPWCFSMWVSAVVVASIDRWFLPLPLPVCWWLASSCIAAWIAQKVDR